MSPINISQSDLYEFEERLDDLGVEYKKIVRDEDYDSGCEIESTLVPYSLNMDEVCLLKQGDNACVSFPSKEVMNRVIEEGDSENPELDLDKYFQRVFVPE